jgi:signal transduction histidine kinase
VDTDAADRIQRLEDRLHVLSGALRAFAEATTDYERLLDVVARTLADVVKDGCVVRLLSDGGWLSAAAVHFPVEAYVRDEDAIARVRAHVAAPHNVAEQATGRRVIETGESLLVPRLDLDQLRSAATPEIVRVYETIGIHSLLLVAMRVRGESIGLLSLFRFAPGSPPFDEHDRELAQALADHAALAITNARLLQAALRELADRERAEAALRKTEEQLRQVQKLEAIGSLAGGVAHDFNNMLSVILSESELILEDLRPGDPLRAEVEEIGKAATRAGGLTRQLLMFSRQQVVQPRVMDLQEVLASMDKMLQRILGEDVELVSVAPRESGRVKVDPSHMEQVILNLVVNARDAMPRGGKLTLETANVLLDENYALSHLPAKAGPHVMLAVSDTGTGMDRETQRRIFEPFFTTKGTGKGTGLGLSTVFGIVQQSGGNIWVYSEPGKGTTFKVYLPRVDAAVVALPGSQAPASLRGGETILLVEDDEPVRAITLNILRRQGYQVLPAQHAGEALLLSERHPGAIDLLLTDVVMPHLSGPELAKRLATERPDMRVLFMSGYTDDSVVRHGALEAGIAFLQKPITPASLATRIREVLDGPRAMPT